MIKSHVRRSQFQIITLVAGSRVNVAVEADEAYIMSLDAALPITLRRSRELELAKIQDQHTSIASNYASCVEFSVAQSNGLVSLASQGAILTNSRQDFPLNVGIKENISFGIGGGTAGVTTQKVLIEMVHYVPADSVAA